MNHILPRISNLNFDLRAISELAQNTKDCLRSDLGQLNFPVPIEFRSIMHKLTDEETFSYAPTLGVPSLNNAIRGFDDNLFSPFEKGISLVTSGGQAALYAILATVINKGDKILTDLAYYPPYKNIAQLTQARLLSTDLLDLSKIDIEGIKVLILNAPNNPTGQIYDKSTLESLAGYAKKYNWIIIEDAVYNKIYFEHPPESIAQFCPERTLIVNSVSKNIAMPGIRIGWIIGESPLVLQVAKMHRNMNSCPNSFFQNVLAIFLPISSAYITLLRYEMKQRRDMMMIIFDKLGWSYKIPQGSIYIFTQIPGLTDPHQFVKYLISNHGISAMPGTLFGNHNSAIRFCFGSLTLRQITILGERLINIKYQFGSDPNY